MKNIWQIRLILINSQTKSNPSLSQSMLHQQDSSLEQRSNSTRPQQRTTLDLLYQLFPELSHRRLQLISETYGDNKIMAIENALALRRAQVIRALNESRCSRIVHLRSTSRDKAYHLSTRIIWSWNTYYVTIFCYICVKQSMQLKSYCDVLFVWLQGGEF